MTKKIALSLAILLIVAISFVGAEGQGEAEGADDYPNRPITLIVPWSPGGSSDAMARALSSVARPYLGVDLNIVNRDGAGGTIATTEVMGAKPDGYTIQLNAVGVMTTQPVLRDVAYSIDDFDYVIGLSYEPIVLAVNTSGDFQTIEDLQNADETILLGANAVGSLPYIAALDAMYQAGVEAEAVPMSGGGPSIAALLGNQVHVGAFHPNEGVQHADNGDLEFLCVASPERADEFPDVPSCYDLGMEVDYSVWKWIQTPAGVDPAIIDFLAEKFSEMKADPQFQQFAENSKLALIDIPGDEVRSRLESQAAATSEAIHQIGIE
jgi:tripartite-type tricarboxylate transporter receptor subunit TctC